MCYRWQNTFLACKKPVLCIHISLVQIPKQPSNETLRLGMQMSLRNTMKHENRSIHLKIVYTFFVPVVKCKTRFYYCLNCILHMKRYAFIFLNYGIEIKCFNFST